MPGCSISLERRGYFGAEQLGLMRDPAVSDKLCVGDLYVEDSSILNWRQWPVVYKFGAFGAITGVAGSLIVQGLCFVIPGGEHTAGWVVLIMWKLMIFPAYTLAAMTGWEWPDGDCRSLDAFMFIMVCVVNTFLYAGLAGLAGLFWQSLMRIKREWDSGK